MDSDLPTPLCDKEFEQVVSDISFRSFTPAVQIPRMFTDSKLEQRIEALIQTSQARNKCVYKASKIVSIKAVANVT